MDHSARKINWRVPGFPRVFAEKKKAQRFLARLRRSIRVDIPDTLKVEQLKPEW